MARDWTIAIGGVYLTEDGLVGGKRCKTDIQGLHRAFITRKRRNEQVSSGDVVSQISPAQNAGIDISIKLEFVLADSFAVIKDIIDDISNGGTTTLYFDGPPGTFNFTAIPANDPIISNLKFRGDYIEEVTYAFKTK